MSPVQRLTSPRAWASIVLALLFVGLLWWLEAGPAPTNDSVAPGAVASQTPTASPKHTRSPSPPRGPGADPGTDPATDPASGLRWVEVSALPREAGEVLRAIDAGGPFVRSKDGSTFGNFEGVLPRRARGHYREYTVPTPGVHHAGARRIVTGGAEEYYWTADHYETFARIRR